MIPYAILSGKIYTVNDRSLDIRILELSSRHVTFRLPKAYLEAGEIIQSIHLSFYESNSRYYRTIPLTSFQCRCMEKEEFYDIYRLDCEEESFKEAADRLSKEYLSYMEDRLFLEDAELSAKMSSYPIDGDSVFANSMLEQKKQWIQILKEQFDVASWDNLISNPDSLKLAFSLENKESMDHFLQKDFQDFCGWYWQKGGLFWHPLAQMKPSMLLIGNPYCPCLFPQEDTIQKIIKKAEIIGIKISFQISPLPQSFFTTIRRRIDWIADLASNANEKIMVYVGDYGVKKYIERKYEGILIVKDGVLLKKGTRDPRLKYRRSFTGNEKNISFHMIEDGICLPYYQCNTGTFCPVYSYCRHGKRDAYERVMDCPGYCEDHYFLYPAHLQLIGRYNSIFGWNASLLCDGRYLEGRKDWVVINL